ncbi:hypothetical protein [Tsuneonella sp. SYSU-LHT278]|uniref:hypothetical protein n=1 Tax=Tsuneonella sediminis TaxID=3416089 RepID=UPI003F79A2D2
MLRASALYVTRRFESLMAIANFGASSLYWLAIAFIVSVSDYGVLMTAQAAILLVVALFTLRTHDMVFFLSGTHGYSIGHAWRAAFTMEVAALALCLAAGSAVIFLVASDTFPSRAVAALFLALSATVIFQQASIAKLRRLERLRTIHAANGLMLVLWALALVWLALGTHGSLGDFLVVGAVPLAGRSLILVVGALAARDPGATTTGPTDWGRVVRFAVSGQAVNFVKNGATSIETTILAIFVPPAPVALYRLTKSAQGMATAFSNVAFQQGSDSIASASAPGHRRDLLRRLRLRGLRGSLATYPFAAAFAALYAWWKPDVGMGEFQLIMAVSFVAMLPQIMLQGAFIVLSLAGRHARINAIYLLSAAALGLFSCALFVVPSIWVFLAGLTAANVLRWALLERAAMTLFRSEQGSPPHAPVGAGAA